MRLHPAFLKFWAGLMLLAAALIGFRSVSGAPPEESEMMTSHFGVPCARDRILVKFKHGVGEDQIQRVLSASGTKESGKIPGIDVRSLSLPAGSRLTDKLVEFRRDPRVAYAHPDYGLQLASTIPSDPYFPYQWGLRNIGQTIAPPDIGLLTGTSGADIKAHEAWDVFQGDAGTLVGVVDTGVDLTHPDLVNRIYSSGADFVNDDDVAQDDHGHGTHMAGIIAAQGNNGLGVSGINWNAWILPVKVFDKSAAGLTSWVANGIIWAADRGARVINLSLGGPDVEINDTLKDALRFAFEHNVVLVAAAGNDGAAGVWFPASYEPYVMAAAASDQNDNLVTLASTNGWWGSNWGPEVDVAAPGRDVLSTWGMGLSLKAHPGWSGYAYGRGTSAATAFVSGLATLIIGFRPDLTNQEVKFIIRASADDVNADTLPDRDDYMGYGRINAAGALERAAAMPVYAWPPKARPRIPRGRDKIQSSSGSPRRPR